MDDSVMALIKYRYENATECIKTAEELLEAGNYKLSLNRSYYALFHSLRAVNLLDGFDSSKHSGVIAHFNQYYAKTKIFPKMVSKVINNAKVYRERADYEDFFVVSKKESEEQINSVREVIALIRDYLKAQGLDM